MASHWHECATRKDDGGPTVIALSKGVHMSIAALIDHTLLAPAATCIGAYVRISLLTNEEAL